MRITARQIDVLQLAANGMIAKQIARALGISARTVQDHLSAMRDHTGARSDGELIAFGGYRGHGRYGSGRGSVAIQQASTCYGWYPVSPDLVHVSLYLAAFRAVSR